MGNTPLNLPAPPILKCAACFAVVNGTDIHCAGCGYPLKGSSIVQTTFIAERKNLTVDFISYDKAIKHAGIALFFLSAIFGLNGVYSFFVNKNDPNVMLKIVPLFVLAIVFLLLGEFSKKKPLACMVIGIGLYGTAEFVDLSIDPASIPEEIFLGIIIVFFLIKGVKSTLRVEKIKKEHHIQ